MNCIVKIERTKVVSRLAFPLALSVALLAPVGAADAQRPITQDPNADRLLIVTFGPGGKTGTTFAEALRDRIPKDIPRKQVWPIPTEEVKINLENSGYIYDSVLTSRDGGLLANRLRAEEFIEGSSVVEDGQWKISARMRLANDAKLVQPLGSSMGRREDHAATGISRAYVEARKSLPAARRCFSAVNGRRYPEAIAAAREAIAVYPQSTLGRICLASAFSHSNQSPDSITPLVDQILEMDSTSYYGLTLGYEAYKKKQDATRSADYLIRLLVLEPHNTVLAEEAIKELADAGQLDLARKLIDQAVAKNPGDPDLMKLRFKILVAQKDHKEVILQGEDLLRTDTSATDTLFFNNLAASYKADSQPRRAAETIASGIAKFPRNARLYTVYSQYLLDLADTSAAIAAALKSIEVAPDDPGVTRTYLTIVMAIGVHRSDSVGPFLTAAGRSAKVSKDSSDVSGFAIAVGANIMKAARADTFPDRLTLGREAFERAIGWQAFADSLAPAPLPKLQQGFAATLAIQHIAIREIPTKEKELGKEGTCQLARLGQSYAVMAQTKVVAGASADPQLAATLMPVILQLAPHLQAVVAKSCS